MEIEQTTEYKNWFKKIRDQKAKARIAIRIKRLSAGNPGQVDKVGEGISEIKINFGPGYRVYYKKTGASVLLLLIGGDKKTQDSDIKKAKIIAKNI